jgi:hypothetical protein
MISKLGRNNQLAVEGRTVHERVTFILCMTASLPTVACLDLYFEVTKIPTSRLYSNRL